MTIHRIRSCLYITLLVPLVVALFHTGCNPPSPESGAEAQSLASPKLPEKVEKVLKYIDEHHEPPQGYEGGREYHNAEGHLPKRDDRGRTITYGEWDVNPKIPGVNRGPERLVTGSDGSAYYTPDHYRTFIRARRPMPTDPVLRPEGPWLHKFVAAESDACDRLGKLQQTDGLRIVCRTIRGRKARTEQALFDEFAAALQFPCYFGENWDALDESLSDLEWLPAEAYVLLITNSTLVLQAEPPDQLAMFLHILERAGQEWSKPKSSRPPHAFHVLLQCMEYEEPALRAKLDAAQVAHSPVSLT